MKITYIAVTIKENGKYYPYVVEVSNEDNLISKLKIKGIVSANICSSKRAAKELVSIWRDSFKENGTYMFDDAPF